MTELISINDAVKLGIERIRKPMWSDPFDHVKIDIIDGQLGPWIHLFCPNNKLFNGTDPVNLPSMNGRFGFDDKDYVPYDGPLPDSDEYRAASEKIEAYMDDLMD